MADNAFTRFTNRLMDVSNITDDENRRNQAMADMLLTQSSQPQPIQHWTQGMAQLANALNAQVYRKRAEKGESALKQQRAREMGDFIQSLGLDPRQAAILGSAPEGMRGQLAGAAAQSALFPEPRPGFTLGTGQARYDADGNVIATAPQEQGGFGDPVNFVDRDGNLTGSYFEGTPEYVAAVRDPNQFPAGDAAQLTPSQRAEQERLAAAGTAENQREQKIKDYMDNYGVNRGDAISLADGLLRIQPDPAGGRTYLIDEVGRSVREIEIRGNQGDRPTIDPGETLWSHIDEATGPVQTTQAAASRISGAFGGPIDEKTVRARQAFSLSENNLIRAFSLNPRYPVAEVQRVQQGVSIRPEFFTGSEELRARMAESASFLKNERDMAEWYSKAPNASRDQRTEDERLVAEIDRYLSKLGVPEDWDSSRKSGQVRIISSEPIQ